jgi:hypothetical protein
VRIAHEYVPCFAICEGAGASQIHLRRQRLESIGGIRSILKTVPARMMYHISATSLNMP